MALALTKQQVVYRQLKTAILDGRLAPGRRLIIDVIATRHGLSIIPVREALHLLQAERLVEIRPHAGATVAPVTPKNIEETFTLLEGVEGVAVRRVARKQPKGLIVRLQDLIRQMTAMEKRHDVEKWSALNMEFHLAISEATGMPWVCEITARALGNWDRIRRYFFREGHYHPFTEALREHRAILAALRARDADEAERVVRRHNAHACRHYFRKATTVAKKPAEPISPTRGGK